MGIVALGLLAVGAAAVFWAGLALGGGSAGRNDDERTAIEAFTETYQRIADDFIGTPLPDALLGGALDGMFDVLDDPYSRYMGPDEFAAQLDDARGEFEGIGAEMNTEDAAGERCEVIGETCRLTVARVLEDTPAEGAGLLAGDIVTGVDGQALAGLTIGDTIAIIRGPRGSEVTLTLERDGEALDLPITRDTVTSDDIHSTTLADGRVGYVSIANFSANAAADFREALAAQLADGVEALVIDVRDDPGGFVDATVEISSQFLEGGAVFWEEDADGTQVSVDVIDNGLATDEGLPLTVLVNAGTASASEILAGALQDAGRARLVGETTFGKGTVQEWNELAGDSGGYRLSVAKWLTRDKHWVDRVGLTPDLVVAADGERYRAGSAGADPETDVQLQTAIAAVLGEPLPSRPSSPEPTPVPALEGSSD